MNGAPPTRATAADTVDLYLRANGAEEMFMESATLVPGNRAARRKKATKKTSKRPRPAPAPPPALDRSPARLDAGRRALALCRTALGVLEAHGALTTDAFELHLATLARWVAGEDADAALDAAGIDLYHLREAFAPSKGMTDDVYLTAQCRSSLAWSLWSVSSYLRGRHDGQVVTRCRMMLAQMLARWDEEAEAAVMRAREAGR